MKVFVFGNLTHETDSAAPNVIPTLSEQFPNIRFIHVDPTENWYQPASTRLNPARLVQRGEEEKELIILDTVVGIDKVTVFNSLDAFEQQTKITPHDYDVYMDLQLLKKIGKVKKITIIGVPTRLSKQTVQQIIGILDKIKSE